MVDGRLFRQSEPSWKPKNIENGVKGERGPRSGYQEPDYVCMTLPPQERGRPPSRSKSRSRHERNQGSVSKGVSESSPFCFHEVCQKHGQKNALSAKKRPSDAGGEKGTTVSARRRPGRPRWKGVTSAALLNGHPVNPLIEGFRRFVDHVAGFSGGIADVSAF
jgi:hypothetical protein